MTERRACDCCGTSTPIDLLDTKPNDPTAPDSCDWEVHECFLCYGSKWLPRNEYQSAFKIHRLDAFFMDLRARYRHWYFNRQRKLARARRR